MHQPIVIEAQELVRMWEIIHAYERLAGSLVKLPGAEPADKKLCRRCLLREKTGYKYCDMCRPLGHRDAKRSAAERRRAA